MTAFQIISVILILAVIGFVVWFFVIHKHVATIHAKVDTILNKVSAPKVQSTTTPGPITGKIT